MSIEPKTHYATLSAKEKNLARVFSDDYVFVIPPYQRPYSWTTEEAGALFVDIVDASNLEEKKFEALPPYFLGSIVLIKDPQKPTSYVVDGQQRITTLTILWSALRDTAKNEAEKIDIGQYIKQAGSASKGTQDQFRLTARARDQEFFHDYIQLGKDSSEERLDKLSDPKANLLGNYRHLLGKISDLATTARQRLIRFLATKCFLVVVEASDEDSAYRVFSVMNDRGLDLSPTDIFKADIIGSIDDDKKQIKYTDDWERWEETLGRENFADLFSHIRMIYRKQKQQDSLIKEVKQFVKPTEEPEKFIKEKLLPYSEAYHDILRKSFEGTSGLTSISIHLKNLSLLDNADWQPPAVLAISEYRNDEAKLDEFLFKLERLAFFMFLTRKDVNFRIRRYGDVLKLLQNDAFDEGNSDPLVLTPNEQIEVLDKLDAPIYGASKIPKPLLLRIDQALSDGAASYNQSIIQIEHICPQTRTVDGPWSDFYKKLHKYDDLEDYDDREAAERAWTDSLGNLVLLTRKKNIQAYNYDFEYKRTKYFKQDEANSLAITNQVISETKWTLKKLNKRTQKLIKLLAKKWKFDESVYDGWMDTE